MDLKHERKTNTAYVKTIDLQLNGNQINLLEREGTRDQLTSRKKLARSLRPCTLRRPMSATPSFGYREQNRSKRLPPWSRPQSAGGSSSHRRNKLAAKFSDLTLHDPDYCPEFGATYTLSSSQLMHSLLGSCSINEGLDSDSTPTPSPQPSLGDTIRAAAQLEPGLTTKPPLPPTPSPQSREEGTPSDDIIALKFQRWFPDAILESEILQRASSEMQSDEGNQSDMNDDVQLSARDIEKPLSGNVSTFVKKLRIPKRDNEEPKKTNVKFNDSQMESNDVLDENRKSPKIIVHEPDTYGCDLVTEEFYSEASIRCLTPDYIDNFKKSRNSFERKNNRPLSLSDLDVKPTTDTDTKSLVVQIHSDSEVYKYNEANVKSIKHEESYKGYSDSEMYKNDKVRDRSKNDKRSREFPVLCKHGINEQNVNGSLRRSSPEIASPVNFEMPAAAYRFTSTPIGHENNKYSPDNKSQGEDRTASRNNGIEIHEQINNSYSNDTNIVIGYDNQNKNCSNQMLSKGEEDKIYHDHLNPSKSYVEGEEVEKTEKKIVGLQEKEHEIPIKMKSKTQEKHAHFVEEVKTYSDTSEPYKVKKTVHDVSKNKDDWPHSDRLMYLLKENRGTESPTKLHSKHGSLENMNQGCIRKSNKLGKEISRAASVPPYPSPKPPVQFSKQPHSKDLKDESSHLRNQKQKVKRSMSYDATVIPEISEKDSGVSSYEDIVTMIRVLEKEDLESPVVNYKTSPPLETLVPEQSSSAKAILNFLDEVERGITAVVEKDKSLNIPVSDDVSGSQEPPVSSRLGSLLNSDTPELAQQVMTLTLQLEEKVAMYKALEDRYKQSVDLLKQQKAESCETDKRHQKFIDQLLKEKRQLAVQYESAIKEMEVKQENAIKVIEERHKVEMKKAQERFNAAEKIRRDKWIDAKTKKIKELTVRGLEPELERMAVTHQEELAELRRVHQRQMTEAESAWSRRAAALREQEANERQAAIMHEREAARHRLEQEMCQVEKSYQEQRRRLLEEVRQEKELLQRQSERFVAEKQAEMVKQVDEAKKKLQVKLDEYDKQHQDELAKLKECLETEKQAWITRQKGALEEKEAALREELKRERDRHIELVIRRLESEAAAKEQAIENKMKRLKESYDSEVSDLDSTLKELRARLKETRADLQRSEDANAALAVQLGQAQNEVMPLKQTIEKLRKEYNEAAQKNESKIIELQKELCGVKQSFHEQVNKIHNEKEKQLQQVYTRVKEAISKKEEALTLVTKQRDAALEQCNRLEKLLETQRNHSLKL